MTDNSITASGPGRIRQQNRRAVLEHLRYHGDAPRSALGSALGLSPAAVSSVTNELLDDGLLVEPSTAPTGRRQGRPVTPLSLNPEAACAMGLLLRPSLDHLSIETAWVDYAGQIDTARTQHGNGVVANGAVVLVAYMERGELLRFDRATGAVSLVAIGGATTAGRDGLVVCGNRLFGVEILSITGTEGVWVTDLASDWASGTSRGRVGASELSGASTAAALDGHLVVVNAQFGVSPKSTPYTLSVLDSSC